MIFGVFFADYFIQQHWSHIFVDKSFDEDLP